MVALFMTLLRGANGTTLICGMQSLYVLQEVRAKETNQKWKTYFYMTHQERKLFFTIH